MGKYSVVRLQRKSCVTLAARPAGPVRFATALPKLLECFYDTTVMEKCSSTADLITHADHRGETCKHETHR